MFNNQPHPSIMAWINKGSSLHAQHSRYCSEQLSAEMLLSAGFCQDQYERGQQFFQALTADQKNHIHTWIRGFIDGKPNEVNSLGMLQDTLFVVEDNGNKLIYDCDGHRIASHTLNPGRVELEVHLAEGYAVLGTDSLDSAKLEGLEFPLLTHYAQTAILVSAIMLALTGTRLLLDATDPNELKVPKGSRALVEVGLLGSIKVLWADDLILKAIRETGLSDVFDAMESATPGRYACCFNTHYEDVDEHGSGSYPVSEMLSFRCLARDNTMIKPYLDTPPRGWQRWRTETEHPDAGVGIPSALGESEYCDVQLRSGDTLCSVKPHDLNWGLFGRGTVELFRVSPHHDTGLGTQTLQLFERCLAAFLDCTPFVDISIEYSRSADWVTQIYDTRLEKNVLSVQAVRKSAMHQRAIQRLLFITPD